MPYLMLLSHLLLVNVVDFGLCEPLAFNQQEEAVRTGCSRHGMYREKMVGFNQVKMLLAD